MKIMISVIMQLMKMMLMMKKDDNGVIDEENMQDNEQIDCALFCCKARRKRLEHERSVGRNTRRSRVFLPTS